ncbi:hypothetical protein COLO4_23024 [Corchorus olitorius]|uniref:Uncharacterized protein n=1 Tax=Corchorus olitorius TaxID=93759 RepID=A0A1R3IIH5_9ROSI|nr:hypothetical protein COLO4_23024 [Corchorus olitorius]
MAVVPSSDRNAMDTTDMRRIMNQRGKDRKYAKSVQGKWRRMEAEDAAMAKKSKITRRQRCRTADYLNTLYIGLRIKDMDSDMKTDRFKPDKAFGGTCERSGPRDR